MRKDALKHVKMKWPRIHMQHLRDCLIARRFDHWSGLRDGKRECAVEDRQAREDAPGERKLPLARIFNPHTVQFDGGPKLMSSKNA